MLEPLLNIDLKPYTYYKIGGPAERLWIPKTLPQLLHLLERLQTWTLLGRGSNVLISDQGLKGDVILTRECEGEPMKVEGTMLHVAGSQSLTQLLSIAGRKHWGGLECLAGIPGSIGGAVAMNAGTHLGAMGSLLLWVDLYRNGQRIRIQEKDMQFSYRSQNFLKALDIVLAVGLKVKPETFDAKDQISLVLKRRKATQPLEYPSCGSVFKNPSESKRAWEVLESLKLRGVREGGAQFSEKHPNFIVNLGSARAEDVRHLIQLAKTRAKEELGVTLEPEVQSFGFES